MNNFIHLQKPTEEINNEQKGFYISFDNSQPKRPKPPLRPKRSPKKERSLDVTDKQDQIHQLEQELNNARPQGKIECHAPQKKQKRAEIISFFILCQMDDFTKMNCFFLFFLKFGHVILSVNKRQNSFSSFENKIRSSYGQAFDCSESNGRGDIDMEPIIVPRKHVSDSQMSSVLDRRHLEDVTNHQQEPQQQVSSPQNLHNRSREANKLIIDDALTKLDPVSNIQ